MEMLVDTFGILDHTKSEKINLEELQNYLRNNFNYEFHLQQKFQKLFGSHGLMNLEEFCDSLGLDINKVRQRLGYSGKPNDSGLGRQQQAPPLQSQPLQAVGSGQPGGGGSSMSKLPGEHSGDDLVKQDQSLPIVTVRSLQTDPDLPKDMEQKIIEIIVGEFRKGTAEKEIPERIKQQLDAQMAPLWHVLMIRGDYWSSHSYEPPNYITLGFGKYLITCWKTPIPQDM